MRRLCRVVKLLTTQVCRVNKRRAELDIPLMDCLFIATDVFKHHPTYRIVVAFIDELSITMLRTLLLDIDCESAHCLKTIALQKLIT